MGCCGGAHRTAPKPKDVNIRRKENKRAQRVGKGVIGPQCHSPAQRVPGNPYGGPVHGGGVRVENGGKLLAPKERAYKNTTI